MISINLFCYSEKVFSFISTWMNRKSFNETTLLEVEEFCGKLNMADNTGPDYIRAK